MYCNLCSALSVMNHFTYIRKDVQPVLLPQIMWVLRLVHKWSPRDVDRYLLDSQVLFKFHRSCLWLVQFI